MAALDDELETDPCARSVDRGASAHRNRRRAGAARAPLPVGGGPAHQRNRRRGRRLWRWVGLDRIEAVADPAADLPDRLDAVTDEQSLRAAIDRLPERLRRVLVLCAFSDLSYEQIGAVLDVAPGTVASRRHEAIARVRQSGKAPTGACRMTPSPRTSDDPASGLDQLAGLTRRVEPLPGGLADLRERIAAGHAGRHSRAAWAGLAVAASVALAILLVLPRSSPDIGAARALFRHAGTAPHPEAVSLGLAAPVRPEHVPDRRIANAPESDVVFFWVAPSSVGQSTE